MRRLAAALVLLAAGTPAASAGGSCIEPRRALIAEEATVVRVEHTCFVPGAIVVDPLTTVTFRNDTGGVEHNLSGPGITLGDLSGGVEREITFESPGLYPFQCTYHPGMAGVVVVRDGDTSPAAAAPEARDGRGPVVPWAAAGGAVLLGAVAAFVLRARGVPVPAR